MSNPPKILMYSKTSTTTTLDPQWSLGSINKPRRYHSSSRWSLVPKKILYIFLDGTLRINTQTNKQFFAIFHCWFIVYCNYNYYSYFAILFEEWTNFWVKNIFPACARNGFYLWLLCLKYTQVFICKSCKLCKFVNRKIYVNQERCEPARKVYFIFNWPAPRST